jgi:hypothetical protein
LRDWIRFLRHQIQTRSWYKNYTFIEHFLPANLHF